MNNRIAGYQEIEYQDYLVQYVLLDILENNFLLTEYWADTPDHAALYPPNHPDIQIPTDN